MRGHRWSAWRFHRATQRWLRHCTVGLGLCTAVQSAPRGHKPEAGK